MTTNAQGEAQTGSLPLGTYTVTETSVPAPLLIDSTPRTVVLAYQNQTTPTVYETVEFTNVRAKGIVKIEKKDSISQDPIGGVIFEIRNAAQQVVDTVTTAEDGTAVSIELPFGTYTVHEVALAPG